MKCWHKNTVQQLKKTNNFVKHEKCIFIFFIFGLVIYIEGDVLTLTVRES